jgi:hypothetical protein
MSCDEGYSCNEYPKSSFTTVGAKTMMSCLVESVETVTRRYVVNSSISIKGMLWCCGDFCGNCREVEMCGKCEEKRCNNFRASFKNEDKCQPYDTCLQCETT